MVFFGDTKRHGILFRVCITIFALICAFVAFTIAVNVYTITSTSEDVHTIAQIDQSGQEVDAILVLGASVYANGQPSDILADRLETASDLFLAGVAPKIIVSGDNESDHYNESDAMKAYCESLGVPSSAIVVDPCGFDTYDSVYRAKNVYGANSMIVVTQAYHLYRALMIANLLGCDVVEGVAADKGSYDNQKQYSLREVFARDKDFCQALLKIPV